MHLDPGSCASRRNTGLNANRRFLFEAPEFSRPPPPLPGASLWVHELTVQITAMEPCPQRGPVLGGSPGKARAGPPSPRAARTDEPALPGLVGPEKGRGAAETRFAPEVGRQHRRGRVSGVPTCDGAANGCHQRPLGPFSFPTITAISRPLFSGRHLLQVWGTDGEFKEARFPRPPESPRL